MTQTVAPCELAEQHFGLTTRLARAFARSQPLLDPDDAAGIAAVTLVECSRRYDPARGASFATFAKHRIYGRLRDEIRTLTGGRPAGPRMIVVPLDEAAGAVTADPTRAADAWLDTLAVLRLLPEYVARRALLVAAGHTNEEVAAAEGVTGGAVCISAHKAARALRASAAAP